MSLLKFFAGIDGAMQPLSPQDAAADLRDPFASNVLLALPPAQWPQSLRAVADLFPSSDNLVFLVGDGGQISDADFPNLPQLKFLDRSLRYVWARKDAPGKNGAGDVLAVGPGDIDSTTSFLQVAAWDPANQRYNYFQRQPPSNGNGLAWTWMGSSEQAFDERCRGTDGGPFCGHLNGSLVMKELKFPWSHWSSSEAPIPAENCPPDVVNDFFNDKDDAQRLQVEVVQPGIKRWTDVRIARQIDSSGVVTGQLGGARSLLRNILTTTTFNLVSSPQKSRADPSQPNPGPISLPLTFFVNSGPIQLLMGIMGGSFPQVSNLFKVPFDIYSEAVKNLGIHLTGDLTTGGTVDIPGETDFAFLVPEPAFEDVYLINSLASKKLFSSRFLLCCLLTDFPNPIYSPARMKLMDYVPKDVAQGTTTAQLENTIIGNIMTGASGGDPAAQEFVGWWEKEREQPLVQAAADAIQTFLTGASAKLATLDGVQDVLRLADFRRRAAFKFNNGLFEFSLTMPVTPGGEAVTDLAMKADGSVDREVPAFQGALRAALTAPPPAAQSKALSAAMALAGCMGGAAARRARAGQGKCPLHFANCLSEHEA